MQSRFQRGKVRGVSPFFAFQDVITSAMAVLITVVMLLALDMGGGGNARSGRPAAEVLEKQWRRLMDALGDATIRLRSAQDAVAAAKLDPAKLEGDLKSLRAELDALQAQSEAKGDQLNEAKHHDGAAIVWSELAKERAVVDSARTRVADLHDKDRQSLDAMNHAAEVASERDQELTDLVGRKNEIWLIPDRAPGSKEPVLAVVSSSGVVFGRFDHPEKVAIEGFNLRAKFENELRNYSKAEQYIVLYFRPSGADNFDALKDAVRKAGFEVGYDVVGEDTIINYNSVR
jgi:hypothetical protein